MYIFHVVFVFDEKGGTGNTVGRGRQGGGELLAGVAFNSGRNQRKIESCGRETTERHVRHVLPHSLLF